MGQQQLLLLVLGAIVVGVAIIIGINMFSSGAVQANKDAVVQDCMTIAARAVNWVRTPKEMGGGYDPIANTKKFTDLTLDMLSWQTDNVNGTYSLTVGANGETLTITGECRESNIKIETTVTAADGGIVTTVTSSTT